MPVRKPRLVKKKVAMLALAVQRQGAVLMVKHPAGKLLGGTWSLPLLDLGRDFADGDRGALSRWRTLLAETGISVSDLRPVPGEIRHIFTHLDVSARLLIGVPRGRLARGGDARFYTRDALPPQSSFSRKLLALLPS